MQIHFQQTLTQQMSLTMTPTLRQAIQILQFSTVELIEFLQEQTMENPLLEVEEWDRWLEWVRGEKLPVSTRSQAEQESFEPEPLRYPSLVDFLEQQLAYLSLTEQQRQICSFLIGCLDERGYLDVSETEVCEQFAISHDEWLFCLQVVQSFEPAGVGARHLIECLNIQLQREEDRPSLAMAIVENYLPELGKGKIDWIARKLQVARSEVEEAVEQIQRCHPRPGAYFSVAPTQYVIPDVWVEKIASDYQVKEIPQAVPPLRINRYYHQLAKRSAELSSDAVQYLRRSIAAAMHLKKGIEQRYQTVQQVSKLIVKHQQAFFEQGKRGLKPLSLKQIAEEAGLHESTVSRATRHKYMQTPQGLYPLRFFFPQGLSTQEGKAISHHLAKEKIKFILSKENRQRPLSDQKIALEMQSDGIHISRRTVAKYREEMGIPASSIRKRSFAQG